MGRQSHFVAVAELSQVLLLEHIAQRHVAGQTEVNETDLHGLPLVGGVVDGEGAERAVAALQVFHQRVAAVLAAHEIGLLVEGVLVEGYEFLVSEQVEVGGAEAAHVAADEQRRVHDAPQSEVGLRLLGVQLVAPFVDAHLEHVHVVVVALTAVGAHIKVLCQDVLHRVPAGEDVLRGAPREPGFISPDAGIGPAADVHAHIGAAGVTDGLGNGGVALALVEVEPILIVDGIAAAEIDLDEVEAQLLEEEVAVLLVVLVESYALAVLVAAVVAAAGVVAAVAVDAGLQAFRVDIVDDGLQTVGKAGGMNLELTGRGVAATEVAVVDVDVVIAGIEQTPGDHGVGLPLDGGLVDIQLERVP